jgi:hypothetical protein
MEVRDMGDEASALYMEDDQLWMRVSPGHSVNADWIKEHAPDLFEQWRAAPGAAQRGRLALRIEQRLEEIEGIYGSLRHAVDHPAGVKPCTALRDRVTNYENAAERLGAIALDNPDRAAAHLAHQKVGIVIRDELAANPTVDGGVLAHRLDAADLVADRPLIEAVAGMDMLVDRLAVAALYEASAFGEPQLSADVIRAEMVREDPQAALQADVLSAVTAAGHNPATLRTEIEARGVDLGRIAPALAPASDFYARHARAIDTRLDREITAGGYADLPSYVASWGAGWPATATLHDAERAIVEHVVGDVIASADTGGRDV